MTSGKKPDEKTKKLIGGCPQRFKYRLLTIKVKKHTRGHAFEGDICGVTIS